MFEFCYDFSINLFSEEGDHQAATKDHCERLMDFQGKMVEASQKFESLEEEHLAQMVTFMIKMAKVRCSFVSSACICG